MRLGKRAGDSYKNARAKLLHFIVNLNIVLLEREDLPRTLLNHEKQQSSAVDYIFVSPQLLSAGYFLNVLTEFDCRGSDHRPLMVSLQTELLAPIVRPPSYRKWRTPEVLARFRENIRPRLEVIIPFAENLLQAT